MIVRNPGQPLAGLSATVAPTSFTGDGTNGLDGQLYQVYSFISTDDPQSFDLSGVDLASRLGATINGPVSGVGGLTYEGPGRLTLANNANSFSGGTTVSAGTLAAATAAALGSGSVTVASGATLEFSNYAAVPNTISGPGTVAFAGGGMARTSTVAGGQATVARILAGTSAAPVVLAPLSFDPTTSWSPRESGTFSDVLGLTNTGGTVQILELSYDPGILAGFPESNLLLGWRDGQSAWVNAILGNTGSAGGSAVFGATGSPAFNNVVATSAYLGSWGVNTTANSVWAVIDHNSEFTVIAVPEPELQAALLLAVGGLGLFRGPRRRRRLP